MIPLGRRTKIRPPRKPVGSHENGPKAAFDFDSQWSILANAITQIQKKNVSTLSYEQLYRVAYTLVLQKCGDQLYETVSALIGSHLEERRARVLQLLDSTVTNTSEEFLKAIVAEWNEHLQSMKFISDVLMYLNRVYVKENRKLLIYDLGILLFEIHFLRANGMEMCTHLINLVIAEISRSRSEAISTRSYIIQTISMLETISEDRAGASSSVPAAKGLSNLYRDEFERKLLESAEKFYTSFSEEAMSALEGTKYLHDIHYMIQDEEARIQSFSFSASGSVSLLNKETYPQIVNLMNSILIKDKLDHILVYPIEMQGLSYWIEPAFSKAVQASDIASSQSRDNSRELQILYELDGRIDPDHKRLKTRLRDVIVAQGMQLPKTILGLLEQQASLAASSGSKSQPITYSSIPFVVKWVNMVLEFQAQLLQLVKTAFSSDTTIEFTIFASIKQFLNQPPNAPKNKASDKVYLNAPELLSVYMDHHIKQFTKASASSKTISYDKSSVDETEEFFKRAVSFLKLIDDKVAFEAHYAAHFARRFLNSKGSTFNSAYSGGDLEELVISRLWDEVFIGSQHLERIVKMRKDVKSSEELTLEWKSFVTEQSLPVADMELKICNLSEWPKSMTKDHKDFTTVDGKVGFIWPTQLRETMRTFEEFWSTSKKNDNKALFWSPKFGSMDLRITYPSKTYDINLSTYAGIIMMLFGPRSTDANGEPVSAFEEPVVLTYDEILELTKIPEADLRRQLRSIAVAPRSRLLTKTPMSKDINPSDQFMLNSKFKSPTTKVKVLTVKSEGARPGGQVKSEEADEVQSIIDEGRRQLINATIVRVMKSRQTIVHNQLIEETIKQLQNRFLPSMIHIKQRIEDLIEKEYLKRDADAPNVYHYIA